MLKNELNTKIENEVEKTLNSMKNMEELQPNQFLFTRIKENLRQSELSPQQSKSAGVAFNPIVIALVIIINVITAVYFFNYSKSENVSEEAIVKTLDKDYQLNNYYQEYYRMQSYELE